LRKRLKDNHVSSTRFAIDTIAGWCLRYAASYPSRSRLTVVEPKGEEGWTSVYDATLKLLVSGAVKVLRSSYSGVFVDEYQDCSGLQHQVVSALATLLPVCVFGDPLQAIFDFNAQAPVDWNTDVFPHFPCIKRLTKPHRWHRLGNNDMANWLEKVRSALETGRPIDFGDKPNCVSWEWLPDQPGPRQSKIVATCLSAMTLEGELVVIGDPINLNARALIAKKLAKQGFSNIEPIDCKTVYTAVKKLETDHGQKRFEVTLDFLEQCMSGISRADFVRAVASRRTGGKLGTANFGNLVDLGLALQSGAGDDVCLALIESFTRLPNTYLHLSPRDAIGDAIGLEDDKRRRNSKIGRCDLVCAEPDSPRGPPHRPSQRWQHVAGQGIGVRQRHRGLLAEHESQRLVRSADPRDPYHQSPVAKKAVHPGGVIQR
jgi:UvrD/REP helicase N-terminal domain